MKKESEDNLLDELLKIEKHEDRMITTMVRLIKSNEKLSDRFNRLTYIMLILTWVTLVISIPNTLATFFGIPKISDTLAIEMIIASFMISLVLPIAFMFIVGFDLQRSRKHT